MKNRNQEVEIKKGLISVIMSVYNTKEEYLRYAIESILSQTYTNFEFIIIDDGSTNNALSVIESYHDDRIVLIKNHENLSLPVSLNKALNICKGEYIARFDSDDCSYPERLEIQYQYMKPHPETIVCGTGVRLIGDMTGEEFGFIPDTETYRVYLLFRNMPLIHHSSAMINRKLLLKYNIRYDESKRYAQDYKLWVCCSRVADCTILPNILLESRVHSKSISREQKNTQGAYARSIMREQLKELHLNLTPNNQKSFLCLGYNKKPYQKATKQWIKDLLSANERYHVYNQKILKQVLTEKWTRITYYGIKNAKSFKEGIAILFRLSPLRYPRLARLAFSKWYRKRHNQ